jgi:hypothetical protein
VRRPAELPCPFQATFERARYAAAYLLEGPTEAVVQARVLQALAARRILAWPVDAGAARLRGRAALALRWAGVDPKALHGTSSGGIAGLADVVGILPGGRALFVEVKRPACYRTSPKTGRLILRHAAGEATDAQLLFLERAHRQGAVAGLTWGPTDLAPLLEAA